MPRSRTLGSLIDEMAERFPLHQAVVRDDEQVTYEELAQLAGTVARGLLALGVCRGERVSLLMSNRIQWLVAYFAIAKVGAVLAPLNTWHQRSELEWTLRHAEPRIVIAEATFLRRDYASDLAAIVPRLADSEPGDLHDPTWPSLRSVVFLGARRPGALTWDELASLGHGIEPGRLAQVQQAVDPEDLAMILYTSGSTSEPKGVTLSHRGAVENCFHIGERRAFDSSDRVWFGSPLFYAFGAVNCVPATVSHGATLILQGAFEADRAVKVMEREACTVFYATSNIIRAVYESPAYSRRRLTTLVKGAAGISVAERRIAIQEMGVRMATQSFGLTEVYGHCALGHPDDPLEVKLSTEGVPLPGNEIRVVDPATGDSLPTGEVGELTVRGYTTHAYYRNPTETAKTIDEAGFLHTGDLGSVRSDGYIRFHSRLKELIKTSGVNVSPTEVEQILLRHPAVSQAYVVGVPDVRRGELVVAFVEASYAVSEEDLRGHVSRSAASFKVPARVLFRTDADLPRLASGKVPRFRLREDAMGELGLR